FPNQRKDSVLVIPIPKPGPDLDFKNISQFTKNAPDEQQQAYLHVRIDKQPKYYQFEEYKNFDDRQPDPDKTPQQNNPDKTPSTQPDNSNFTLYVFFGVTGGIIILFMLEYLQELNEQQKQAVYEKHHRVCVIAGP
ncbi:4432_t:CDS:2, partial [Entrophospora sp. SA101]